jgi:membrane-anchored protein YejM (alkaline phosphatase superfamily)
LPFWYWCTSLAVVLALILAQSLNVHLAGATAVGFFGAAAAGYAALFLLPLLLVSPLVRLLGPLLGAAGARATGSVLLVVLSSLVQLGLLVDWLVYRMFGFHLNGFVWNLVSTPGGLESMGADDSAWVTVAGVTLLVLGANALLLRWARRQPPVRAGLRALVAMLLLCAIGERLVYGISHFTGRVDVVNAAVSIPFYQPTTFRHAAQTLGFTPAPRQTARVHVASGTFGYPRAPLRIEPPARLPNIVWLVAESLRADALDPNVMPATSAFAANAVRFDHHYSSGNGTRMGLFGMFYGLYGSDWFPVLAANRQPVLMEALQRLDYRIEAWTSARFSYPEFDRTVFAGLPTSALHEQAEGAGWQRDRANVSELLDYVQRARSAPDGRPFMAFMFFESAHARYYFPPENAVFKPYLEDFNYATVSLERDIDLIHNRYRNACNHLDSQFGRVFAALQAQGLLDNTIVVVTGDHGEEFMEKGRWGHNSSFVDEQIRTPLLLRLPGVAPARVEQMSSHLDLPATVLARVGVRNDPAEFSLGHDLFGGGPPRTSTVVSDWSSVAWIAPHYKAVYPLAASGLADAGTYGADDRPAPDARQVRAAHLDDLQLLLRGIAHFHGRQAHVGALH